MRMVNTKFKTGGLHEKHVVATWNLGNHLSICLYDNFKSHVTVMNSISVATPEFRSMRGVDAEINACSANRLQKYQSGSARLIRLNSDSLIPFVGSHLVDACLDPCRVQALFIWRCSGKVFFRGVLRLSFFLYTYFVKNL